MRQTAAVVLVLFVMVPCVAAQTSRGMGARPAAPMPVGDLTGVIVAPDGTVLSFAPVTTPGLAFEVTAISPAGTKIWTYASTSMPHHFVFDGSLAVFVGGMVVVATPARPYQASFELVALNLVTGAVAWKLPIEGFAPTVHSGGGQFYVVALTTTGAKKLSAVSNSGAILWTQTL